MRYGAKEEEVSLPPGGGNSRLRAEAEKSGMSGRLGWEAPREVVRANQHGGALEGLGSRWGSLVSFLNQCLREL